MKTKFSCPGNPEGFPWIENLDLKDEILNPREIFNNRSSTN
jgi:hypothetical protein